MPDCLVSVVIPVFNIAPHLRQCLDSVVGQTLKELEVICVDDGSTDESPTILEEYARKDGRVRVIHQANQGPGGARNTGMELARGEYVIFLDSDDWFEPDFLEQMSAQATRTGADVTICRGVEFDTETGEELSSDWMLKKQYLPSEIFAPQEIADHIFQFTYGMAWDKLYRRKLLSDVGIQFPILQNSEDLSFVFPTLLSAERIAILDIVFIHHRVHRMTSVSNTRSRQPNAPYEAFCIVRDFLERTNQMDFYHRSFLNWAMEFLVWHVSSMDNPIIQRKYFKLLRQTWFPTLNFAAYPVSYYENKFTYLKYLLARYAPYWLFATVLRGYKLFKRGNQARKR